MNKRNAKKLAATTIASIAFIGGYVITAQIGLPAMLAYTVLIGIGAVLS
jgi:hypothetical protein